MSEFTLKINTDNSAFSNNTALELSRILKSTADKIEYGEFPISGEIQLMDINGNKVGHAKYNIT